MKKYQIFVSSTYTNLKEERLEVINTILECNCIPAGMEIFSSNSEEQFEVIKKVIDMCDLYVLIISDRYGSISPKTGESYTKMEFDYAVSKNIPVLAFINDSTLQNKDIKNYELLRAFVEKVQKDRIVTFWNNKDNLAKKVMASIYNEVSKNESLGWVRGDEIDIALNNNKTLVIENNKLVGDVKKLKEEVESLNSELQILKSTNGDLLFDEHPIEIPCKLFISSPTTYVEENLKTIFKHVSIQFIGVTWAENSVIDFINESLNVYKVENAFAKRIINQFIALKLMHSKWVKEKGLYYGLTAKGEKIRNELNLFLK